MRGPNCRTFRCKLYVKSWVGRAGRGPVLDPVTETQTTMAMAMAMQDARGRHTSGRGTRKRMRSDQDEGEGEYEDEYDEGKGSEVDVAAEVGLGAGARAGDGDGGAGAGAGTGAGSGAGTGAGSGSGVRPASSSYGGDDVMRGYGAPVGWSSDGTTVYNVKLSNTDAVAVFNARFSDEVMLQDTCVNIIHRQDVFKAHYKGTVRFRGTLLWLVLRCNVFSDRAREALRSMAEGCLGTVPVERLAALGRDPEGGRMVEDVRGLLSVVRLVGGEPAGMDPVVESVPRVSGGAGGLGGLRKPGAPVPAPSAGVSVPLGYTRVHVDRMTVGAALEPETANSKYASYFELKPSYKTSLKVQEMPPFAALAELCRLLPDGGGEVVHARVLKDIGDVYLAAIDPARAQQWRFRDDALKAEVMEFARSVLGDMGAAGVGRGAGRPSADDDLPVPLAPKSDWAVLMSTPVCRWWCCRPEFFERPMCALWLLLFRRARALDERVRGAADDKENGRGHHLETVMLLCELCQQDLYCEAAVLGSLFISIILGQVKPACTVPLDTTDQRLGYLPWFSGLAVSQDEVEDTGAGATADGDDTALLGAHVNGVKRWLRCMQAELKQECVGLPPVPRLVLCVLAHKGDVLQQLQARASVACSNRVVKPRKL